MEFSHIALTKIAKRNYVRHQLLYRHKIICIIACFSLPSSSTKTSDLSQSRNWWNKINSNIRKRFIMLANDLGNIFCSLWVVLALNVKLCSFFLQHRKYGWKKTHLIFFVTRELHSCINKNIIFYAMPFSFRCHNDNESCCSLLVFILFMLVALSFEICFFEKQSFHSFQWVDISRVFWDISKIFRIFSYLLRRRYFWLSSNVQLPNCLECCMLRATAYQLSWTKWNRKRYHGLISTLPRYI